MQQQQFAPPASLESPSTVPERKAKARFSIIKHNFPAIIGTSPASDQPRTQSSLKAIVIDAFALKNGKSKLRATSSNEESASIPRQSSESALSLLRQRSGTNFLDPVANLNDSTGQSPPKSSRNSKKSGNKRGRPDKTLTCMWNDFCTYVTDHQLVLPTNGIEIRSRLGRGKFAAVYDGVRQVPIAVSDNVSPSAIVGENLEPVALKVAQFIGNDEAAMNKFTLGPGSRRGSRTSLNRQESQLETTGIPPIACSQEFHREVSTLVALGEHPNILRLFGVVLNPLTIVIEKMTSSLSDCLDQVEWQVTACYLSPLSFV